MLVSFIYLMELIKSIPSTERINRIQVTTVSAIKSIDSRDMIKKKILVFWDFQFVNYSINFYISSGNLMTC